MSITLNESNFNETIAKGVTLVDFWAEWCGPCQMMMPILEELTTKMWDKANIAKVNVDEQPSLAAQFRVMSIPTLIVFKDGQPVEQMVGVQQADQLEAVLNKYL